MTPVISSDIDHRRLAVLGPTECVDPYAPFCVLADLTGPLPFASGVFDLVFNFRYFHHVGDRQQRRDTLAELVRISRRYLIVSYYDRPLIHLAVKKLQYLPRRPRRRTVDMVPSREFKRLFQTLGCRLLADRAILPGLHAQVFALLLPLLDFQILCPALLACRPTDSESLPLTFKESVIPINLLIICHSASLPRILGASVASSP